MVLIHSRIGLADPELLPSVRQEAKEVLLQKGVELLLGMKMFRNKQRAPAQEVSALMNLLCRRSQSVRPDGAAAQRDPEEHGGHHR